MKSAIDLYVIEAIRRRRMDLNMSQATLAECLQVSKGFIGMAESPKYNIKYNLRHINLIAKYLECSPRDFLPEKPL